MIMKPLLFIFLALLTTHIQFDGDMGSPVFLDHNVSDRPSAYYNADPEPLNNKLKANKKVYAAAQVLHGAFLVFKYK